ncbi:hypothetical protein M407DRAFT_20435 [Tulasnella calospora MUT 4182]|uniref:Uncharacterized protein n=1 Tax=Tulasnella calospora MUT 4182 TaxID=1051891 RepID=A0A0C3MA20_9AGAM|nr:hypothetical protein M407DRAFT_20435 [Tulasnella calospora MUT 4182]
MTLPPSSKAWKLCESKDEFLDFLLDHGFEDQRISFLDSITEHERIAQVLWEAGDYVNAALRFGQSDDPSSPRQASRCILEGIRSNVPLATSYRNESTTLSKLFKLSQTATLTPDEKAEVEFLRAVVNLDGAELKQYSQDYLDKQDLRGALLALDAWTQSATLDGLRSTRDGEVAESAPPTSLTSPESNISIQHIFGISDASSKEPARQPRQSEDITMQRIVRPCSFIHALAFALVSRGEQPRSRADPITLPTNTVDDMIGRALLNRLNAVIERVDEIALKSRAFEMCQQFLVNQECGGRDEGSCWKGHVLEKDLSIEKFNSRFRLHILVIAVLNLGVFDERIRSIKQKMWITKLFQLCYPATNKAGCLSDITPALIPEYSLAMPVVQCWLHEVFRSLRPADQVKYFLTNILITSLLATAFDYKEATTYLWRGQWSLDPQYAFQNGLIQENSKPAVGSAIIWLAKRTSTRINLGIHFLTHVLKAQVHLDAEVAVAFAEEVSAQLILNHYAHSSTGYDYMVMPRSWILRAFTRAEAPQLNGSMPWALATVLDTFLSILLLKQSAGKLQMRGSVLRDVSIAVRSQAVQRVCRCLALIGQNIIGIRAPVLGFFGKLGSPPVGPKYQGIGTSFLGFFKKLAVDSPLVRPEYQRFAQATNWDGVVDALVGVTRASTMDELLMIRRDVGHPTIRPRFKTVVCPDGKDILAKLRISQYPPVIALQSDILCPGGNLPGFKKQEEGVSGNGVQTKSAAGPGFESVPSTPEDRRSASIIQAFFRRHRRRAGGPIAAVFERLAQKLKKRTRNYKLARPLLLCIRGPLPHVVAYLLTLRNISDKTIQTLNRNMQKISHEKIEELHEKGVEVRRIRDAIIRLGEELQPSSSLYSNRLSATPVSALEIVKKVEQVPELVRKLQNSVDCPEDLDYKLGVEPILSNRGPWAL